jgi:hypothetical protein
VKPSEVVTAIIAVYGAALSTFTVIRQWKQDKPKVKVSVRKNMQIMGDPRYHNVTVTVITVTNCGKRPVTITTLGAHGLHPHKSFATIDSQPQLPVELTQGKYLQTFWPQNDLDFSHIDRWCARDSHDRSYCLREASWLDHWKSQRRWKRQWKAEHEAKAGIQG